MKKWSRRKNYADRPDIIKELDETPVENPYEIEWIPPGNLICSTKIKSDGLDVPDRD